jgi:hypothetical protein
MRVKSDGWRRRHALQIVAQLPENHDDAIAVLELARELVDGFLAGEGQPDHPVLMAFPSASERR